MDTMKLTNLPVGASVFPTTALEPSGPPPQDLDRLAPSLSPTRALKHPPHAPSSNGSPALSRAGSDLSNRDRPSDLTSPVSSVTSGGGTALSESDLATATGPSSPTSQNKAPSASATPAPGAPSSNATAGNPFGPGGVQAQGLGTSSTKGSSATTAANFHSASAAFAQDAASAAAALPTDLVSLLNVFGSPQAQSAASSLGHLPHISDPSLVLASLGLGGLASGGNGTGGLNLHALTGSLGLAAGTAALPPQGPNGNPAGLTLAHHLGALDAATLAALASSASALPGFNLSNLQGAHLDAFGYGAALQGGIGGSAGGTAAFGMGGGHAHGHGTTSAAMPPGMPGVASHGAQGGSAAVAAAAAAVNADLAALLHLQAAAESESELNRLIKRLVQRKRELKAQRLLSDLESSGALERLAFLKQEKGELESRIVEVTREIMQLESLVLSLQSTASALQGEGSDGEDESPSPGHGNAAAYGHGHPPGLEGPIGSDTGSASPPRAARGRPANYSDALTSPKLSPEKGGVGAGSGSGGAHDGHPHTPAASTPSRRSGLAALVPKPSGAVQLTGTRPPMLKSASARGPLLRQGSSSALSGGSPGGERAVPGQLRATSSSGIHLGGETVPRGGSGSELLQALGGKEGSNGQESPRWGSGVYRPPQKRTGESPVAPEKKGGQLQSAFPPNASGQAGQGQGGKGGASSPDKFLNAPLHPKNAPYKRDPCRHWVRKGVCKYGSLCGFKHGDDE